MSYHVMVFRAINNRFDVYDLRDIDIYFESKSVTEDIVRKNLVKPKFCILGAIQLVEEHASAQSGLKPIMQILKSQIDEYYENILIQLGEEIFTKLKQHKLAPQDSFNPFWEGVQDRWGKGSGYRNDVLAMYQNQIEEIDSSLKDRVQELWQKIFMEKILSFFGDKECEYLN